MASDPEIKKIKERLDHIESFLREQFPAAPAQLSQPTESSAYELLSFDVKQSQSLIGPEYSYKLRVKNNASTARRFDGAIIFLDHEDFEVDREVMMLFTVAAGETVTRSGKATIVDKNRAARIANVTAEIYPM